MEIDRVKFMVASYLRTRIVKIQRHPLYITKSAEMMARLSPAEREFVGGFVEDVELHMATVLDQLPAELRKLDAQGAEGEMVKAPDLDTYVFCRVNEDLGEVEMNAQADISGNTQEDQTVQLDEGDTFALRYESVRDYLAAGKIDLI